MDVFTAAAAGAQNGSQLYDYIVVGAGSAGCAVGGRLAEEKKHVLLIEAGGDPPIESSYPAFYTLQLKSYLDWNYTNHDDKCSGQCQKSSLVLSRGKMIGGSNSLGGMVYVRGNPHDFNRWAEIANDSTWSYEEVLPLFQKSENLVDQEVLNSQYGKLHGTDGPMKVTRQRHEQMEPYLKAFEEIGHNIVLDTSTTDNMGYSYPMCNIAEGRRWSAGYAFISQSKDNPYLHVRKNTLVTKILFDDNNNAIGVEAITDNEKTVILQAKNEVILSAGPFNSPQLLMLSGIGPKSHLESMGIKVRSNLPVGENLQDQLGVFLMYSMDRSKSPVVPEQPSTEFPSYLLLGYSALDKSQSYPDYQAQSFRLTDDKKGTLSFCTVGFNLLDEICQQVYEVAENRTILFNSIVGYHLKSRGYVRLNSTNPKDLAITSVGWFNVEEDLNTAAKYIEDFIKVGDSAYFKSVDAELLLLDLPQCKDIKKGTRDYWKCYVRCMWVPEFHYGGTCALGSVVDSRLQVKGVNKLRVADSSVMPILPSANINAATVMIGEKAAQFILNDYTVY
ncbi:GMC oxidoreductase domain-containing protein [Phthorimaea operculella]|nr:GMC oxidoreductase domain-containing protein [Phthorimaea operculella]